MKRLIGKDFFERHQSKLLWLLNKPLVNKWFRRVLCIDGDKSAVGSREIVKIEPNSIFWDAQDGQQTAEFRTRDKFAKRIYYAFLPAWLLLGYSHPYKAFSNNFFQKYQERLLWLLNNKHTKSWFRYCMRINGDRSGLGDSLVSRILPNVIYWNIDDGRVAAEFTTDPKFSKRLYYAFRPIWWAMHFWDWIIADRWIPELSFGFRTLTFRPDAHPETTSCDGRVRRDGADETWFTIRQSAGSNASASMESLTVFDVSRSATTNQWASLARAFALFDTSSLYSMKLSLDSADIYLNVSDKDEINMTPPIDIAVYRATPATNTDLVNADFTAWAIPALCDDPVAYADLVVGAWKSFALNNSGLLTINPNGVTKFAIMNANYDAGNVAPTWADNPSSYVIFKSSEADGGPYPPQLRITGTPQLKGNTFLSWPNQGELIPEVDSVDGKVLRNSTGESWATIIAGAGTAGDPGGSIYSRIAASSVIDEWVQLGRGVVVFDTKSLPNSSTLTAATLTMSCGDKYDPSGMAQTISLCSVNTASDTDIVAADFIQFGSTPFIDSAFTYASFTVGEDKVFTLNSSGLANINKAAATKIGSRNYNYDMLAASPPWSSNGESYVLFEAADNWGQVRCPRLLVTYSMRSPFGGARSFGNN